MVNTVCVADRRLGQPAQVQQAVPVGVVARQTLDFQAQRHPQKTDLDPLARAPATPSSPMTVAFDSDLTIRAQFANN